MTGLCRCENQAACSNVGDRTAGTYTLDKTGKTYSFNPAGFAALRHDCITRGAHAGSRTQAPGVGYGLWVPFLIEHAG